MGGRTCRREERCSVFPIRGHAICTDEPITNSTHAFCILVPEWSSIAAPSRLSSGYNAKVESVAPRRFRMVLRSAAWAVRCVRSRHRMHWNNHAEYAPDVAMPTRGQTSAIVWALDVTHASLWR